MYTEEIQTLLNEFQSTYERLRQHENGLPYPGCPGFPYMPISGFGYMQDAEKLRTCAEKLRELLPDEIHFQDAHINSTYNTREVAYVKYANVHDKRLSTLMHDANEQLFIDFYEIFQIIRRANENLHND